MGFGMRREGLAPELRSRVGFGTHRDVRAESGRIEPDNSTLESEMKMKICFAALFCMLSICLYSPASGAEEARTLKESLRSIATEIVTTGKEAMTGLSEGVEQGMGEEAAGDGKKTVKSNEEFARLLAASLVSVKSLGRNSYELTLAVRNDNDFPVRIRGLWELEKVVLLDKDGFSYSPERHDEQLGSVTALSKSLTRLRFVFSGVESAPAVLRFYGKELAVPGVLAGP